MTHKNHEITEEYLKKARITDELCPNSIIKYRESIKRFVWAVGNKSFGDLRMEDFDDFIFQAKDRGNEGNGIRSVIYAVKWIMKKLQDKKIISKKVNLEKINMPRIRKKEVVYLTREEIGEFFQVIEEELEKSPILRKIRTMTLYILLLETGARIDEALSIKIKDIDFTNGEIPIIGKGRKPRTLFLHKKAVYWIKRYLEKRNDSNEYLFVNREGSNKWSYNDACRSFQRYKLLSGINKDFKIHTFRHTFATQLLHNNVPINQVSYLLGHENLETTIKYYIGATKKDEARRFITDKHFDFMPESELKNLGMQ